MKFIRLLSGTIALIFIAGIGIPAYAGGFPNEEYKCYTNNESAPTFPLSLRDQFGDMENVLLEDRLEFCASANKQYQGKLFTSPHGFENHLNCYDFDDKEMSAPIDPNTGLPFVVDLLSVGQQFPDEFGVEVGPPVRLCVPTAKEVQINGGEFMGPFPPVDSTHYKCYSITGVAPVPNGITLFDQFVPTPCIRWGFE